MARTGFALAGMSFALVLLGLALTRLGSQAVGGAAVSLLGGGHGGGSRVDEAIRTNGLVAKMSQTIAGEELSHIKSVSDEVLDTDPDAGIHFGGSGSSLARKRQRALDNAAAADRKENKQLSTPRDADDVLGAINALPSAPRKVPAARHEIVKTKPAAASKARMDMQHATKPISVGLVRTKTHEAKAAVRAATSKAPAAAKSRVQPILLEEGDEEGGEEGDEEEGGGIDFIKPHGEEEFFDPEGDEGEEPEEGAAAGGRPGLGDEVFDLPADVGGVDNGDVHVPGDTIRGYTFRQAPGRGPQQLSDDVPFLGEGPWVKVPVEGEMSGAGVGANEDGSNGIPVDRWWDESAVVGGQETAGLGEDKPLGGGLDVERPAGELPSVYGVAGPTNGYFRAPVAQQLQQQARMAAAARQQGLHEQVPRKLSCIGGEKGVCGDEVISPYTDKREGDIGLPASAVQPYFYAAGGRRRGGGQQQMLAEETRTTGTFRRGGGGGGRGGKAKALMRDLGRDVASADRLVMRAARVTSPDALWRSVWSGPGRGSGGATSARLAPAAGQQLEMGDPHNRDNVKCIGKVCGDETLDGLGNKHVKSGEVFKKGWSGWSFFNKDPKGAEMLARPSARHTYEDGGRLHRGESDTDSQSEMARFYDRLPTH